MQLLGINKGVERTELQPGESPDAANCFFHEGRAGILGQREGKTFVNSTAYTANVMGVPQLVSSGGSRYWQVGQTDGSAAQVAAPLAAYASVGLSDAGYRKYNFTTTGSISGAWPAGTTTSVLTLDKTIAAGSYQFFLPREFSLTLGLTGGNQEGSFTLYIWLRDSGNNVISNLPSTFYLDKAGDGMIVAADATTFYKSSLTLSGTATNVLFAVAVGPDPTVTSYSYTAGPFTHFYLRGT